jgi:hypothetical protein
MNEKRMNILKTLTNFKLHVITNGVFGEDLVTYLKRSKIILNIHYYDNAILERVRINEALHFGTYIVSELPNENDVYSVMFYDGVVNFVDSVDQIPQLVENILSNYSENISSHLERVKDFTALKSQEFFDNLKKLVKTKSIVQSISSF